MKFTKIEVRAAHTVTEAEEDNWYIVEERNYTIKDAKARAKHLLTDEYFRYMKANYETPEEAQHCEPLRYAEIWVTEVDGLEMYCHSDYFAKGYVGEPSSSDLNRA
jgi:hypothetical protein